MPALRKLRRVLAQTGTSVSDVAGSVGFANIAHFGRGVPKSHGDVSQKLQEHLPLSRPVGLRTISVIFQGKLAIIGVVRWGYAA